MTYDDDDQIITDFIKLKYKLLLPYLLSPELSNKKSSAYQICTALAPEFFDDYPK